LIEAQGDAKLREKQMLSVVVLLSETAELALNQDITQLGSSWRLQVHAKVQTLGLHLEVKAKILNLRAKIHFAE
jgi:hypothetical protein